MSAEVIKCASCGNQIPAFSAFCLVCGTANPDWPPADDAVTGAAEQHVPALVPSHDSPVRGWKPLLIDGLAPLGGEAVAPEPISLDEPPQDEAPDAELPPPLEPPAPEYDLSSLLDQIQIAEPETVPEEIIGESEPTGDAASLESTSATASTAFEQPAAAQIEQDTLPSWSPGLADDSTLPVWRPDSQAAAESESYAWEATDQSTQHIVQSPKSVAPWVYGDPGKPRPKPGTPEYDEMVRQAMEAQRHRSGSAQGTQQQSPFSSPDAAPEPFPSPQPTPSTPKYADPNAPRPKPGTPEYEAMVREAMKRKTGSAGPLENAPSYDTGPLPQEPPSPLVSPTSGASRPKPGTPEYEAMVKQALEEARRKREGITGE